MRHFFEVALLDNNIRLSVVLNAFHLGLQLWLRDHSLSPLVAADGVRDLASGHRKAARFQRRKETEVCCKTVKRDVVAFASLNHEWCSVRHEQRHVLLVVWSEDGADNLILSDLEF